MDGPVFFIIFAVDFITLITRNYMKKILLSAMMIMAMMCATTNASAQDHKCDKDKKECCEKKKACCDKKDAKACCDKKDAKHCDKKDAKACDKKDAKQCDKKDAKASCGGNCEKCTECKATCSKTNCKDCKHKGQCKKNCKK